MNVASGSIRRLPPSRQQFWQLAHGRGGDAGQHVAEVIERVQAVALAGGDEAEEDGGGVAERPYTRRSNCWS